MINVDSWLKPLDGASPSGEDLRNDPIFHQIERLSEPQVEVARDDNNRPTSEVTIPGDWSAVLAKAEELQAKGRDLRLLVLVTRALASEDGFAGLVQGLTLIARTLDEFWDTVHPALRPATSIRDAAVRRINAVRDLQNGQDGLLASLRQMVVFSPRITGPITGRDLEQAALDERLMLQEAAPGFSNTEKAALADRHDQLLKRIRIALSAMAEQAAADLDPLVSNVRSAIVALETMDRALNSRIEGQGSNVPDLKRFLERVAATLERAKPAQKSVPNAATQSVVGAPPQANGHAPEAAISMGALAMTLPDRIHSRDDVVRCLDLVISFYDRTEPSSPIPHLAKRTRRMVHMDFVELMEEMAPSGLKEFRLLAGVPDKKTAQKDER
ncbi:type VI secretion system protein TssA [Mesorhizobium sp. BR1-1-16]|uniref:type VI secretion system protein TssA n=1 Tax=Mesorhizobium sp. BR1-1-16 TaxID=2876653 RepID=UPI001CCCF493|nr:type VI secretion system protein TssA [Mesorhizobium sp. BR1-1-16]MBZ9936350.1 type VI secretion system protein TssA [Mesorhizobium sp. BR1-1-16]